MKPDIKRGFVSESYMRDPSSPFLSWKRGAVAGFWYSAPPPLCLVMGLPGGTLVREQDCNWGMATPQGYSDISVVAVKRSTVDGVYMMAGDARVYSRQHCEVYVMCMTGLVLVFTGAIQ